MREQDLNLRPSGYEPDELPGCSIPRQRRCCKEEYRFVLGCGYRASRYMSHESCGSPIFPASSRPKADRQLKLELKQRECAVAHLNMSLVDPAATYSPAPLDEVPSALEGLTTEFGMGSGVEPPT